MVGFRTVYTPILSFLTSFLVFYVFAMIILQTLDAKISFLTKTASAFLSFLFARCASVVFGTRLMRFAMLDLGAIHAKSGIAHGAFSTTIGLLCARY